LHDAELNRADVDDLQVRIDRDAAAHQDPFRAQFADPRASGFEAPRFEQQRPCSGAAVAVAPEHCVPAVEQERPAMERLILEQFRGGLAPVMFALLDNLRIRAVG